MDCYNIMILLVNNRVKNAAKLQEALTESGCMIKMRLGLHDAVAAADVCSNEGLIILQLVGSDEDVSALEKKLNSVEGVKARNNKICSEW
ncbi:MAG: hypothetical protein GXY17_11675 [Clostridiaceae bacterium]|nr:hypothetical protein [Clostridiaceae bacterium]